MRKINLKSTYIPLSSLCAISLLLFGSILQAGNQKKIYFIDTTRQLELANEKLGGIIGNTRDTLSFEQKKNALKMMRLISHEKNINCVRLSSNRFSIVYPPKIFCDSLLSHQSIGETLINSSDIKLDLFVSDEELNQSISKIYVNNLSWAFRA